MKEEEEGIGYDTFTLVVRSLLLMMIAELDMLSPSLLTALLLVKSLAPVAEAAHVVGSTVTILLAI